jgi:hypothetical protein
MLKQENATHVFILVIVIRTVVLGIYSKWVGLFPCP